MNLATYRARISGAIGLDNTASSVEQGLIDGWVNEGVVQFLVETKAHLRTASLALTADKGDYELDTDILSFKDLWLDSGTSTLDRTLEQVDTEEIIRLRLALGANNTGIGVCKYAIQGGNIFMLYPNAGAGDVLHMLYVPRPAAMSATADTPSATANGGIPEEFHHVIEAYAKWKAADYADDKSSQYGMTYMQEWQSLTSWAKDKLFKKAGMRTSKARVGRGRYTPLKVGVDKGV